MSEALDVCGCPQRVPLDREQYQHQLVHVRQAYPLVAHTIDHADELLPILQGLEQENARLRRYIKRTERVLMLVIIAVAAAVHFLT